MTPSIRLRKIISKDPERKDQANISKVISSAIQPVESAVEANAKTVLSALAVGRKTVNNSVNHYNQMVANVESRNRLSVGLRRIHDYNMLVIMLRCFTWDVRGSK